MNTGEDKSVGVVSFPLTGVSDKTASADLNSVFLVLLFFTEDCSVYVATRDLVP